jgi:hypothetical protein
MARTKCIAAIAKLELSKHMSIPNAADKVEMPITRG